ncbi:hypothetical protein [Mesorhizobium captivum]|uniref:Uncharacterized protein n=1 Tax=Mesorhizobium captivum TaxID=3072319 RepID=A0ABU4YU22_9HYPH|nr:MULTISPECIES: hypothetical protein [unclassified Mesorhizobium]MDX8445651.1 hypothetical protein [Mesorhizobium sp. VK3C]MDX8490452.1 hypothetical protein [Mesorhizobium sp. VK22B]MDX8504692.1 hypothetical protein [Mesorhizobium sp. VK22E]
MSTGIGHLSAPGPEAPPSAFGDTVVRCADFADRHFPRVAA